MYRFFLPAPSRFSLFEALSRRVLACALLLIDSKTRRHKDPKNCVPGAIHKLIMIPVTMPIPMPDCRSLENRVGAEVWWHRAHGFDTMFVFRTPVRHALI